MPIRFTYSKPSCYITLGKFSLIINDIHFSVMDWNYWHSHEIIQRLDRNKNRINRPSMSFVRKHSCLWKFSAIKVTITLKHSVGATGLVLVFKVARTSPAAPTEPFYIEKTWSWDVKMRTKQQLQYLCLCSFWRRTLWRDSGPERRTLARLKRRNSLR